VTRDSPRRQRQPSYGSLITQRRLETSRRASTWLQRNATADWKSASGALREARDLTAYALAAPIAPIIALTALAALGLSGYRSTNRSTPEAVTLSPGYCP
jgi:hypothetical protein